LLLERLAIILVYVASQKKNNSKDISSPARLVGDFAEFFYIPVNGSQNR
jgi:hypothetical protein